MGRAAPQMGCAAPQTRAPPRGQICRQYSTLAPPIFFVIPFVISLPEMPVPRPSTPTPAHAHTRTLAHRPRMGAFGGQVGRQCSTLAHPGARFGDNTRHWRPRGPDLQTVHHIGSPREPDVQTVQHIGAFPGARFGDSTAHWRHRGPDLQTVQHIGATGGQICRQYSTQAPPRGPDLQTVQHIGAPGCFPIYFCVFLA